MNGRQAARPSAFDVVIVAGGAGSRLGASLPKAFVTLAGKPLYRHSFEVFENHPLTSSIILVVPEDMVDRVKSDHSSRKSPKKIRAVKGGKERWLSVRCGAGQSESEWIMVHDAARPFVTHAVIDALLDKASNYDAVITATPETDTIRAVEADRCVATIDRSSVVRVGTPQLFRAKTLMESFVLASSMASPPTDEAMLMEKIGVAVGFAWGDPLNFKITTQADLTIAEALCARKAPPTALP